jgi:hypothetical protein
MQKLNNDFQTMSDRETIKHRVGRPNRKSPVSRLKEAKRVPRDIEDISEELGIETDETFLRAEVSIHGETTIVEKMEGDDEWVPWLCRFAVYKQRNDGEWVHEEAWNHYPDDVWNGSLCIEKRDGHRLPETIDKVFGEK